MNLSNHLTQYLFNIQLNNRVNFVLIGVSVKARDERQMFQTDFWVNQDKY